MLAIFPLGKYLREKDRPWYPSIDPSDILLSLIIFFSVAGRTLGIDYFLLRRFPRIPCAVGHHVVTRHAHATVRLARSRPVRANGSARSFFEQVWRRTEFPAAAPD